MKPLELYIQDFMNHKKTEVSFSNFKSALIVGKTKNNDSVSNGVGKSSIFSAIEWCLFNKVHKTTLDKVVRDDAKKCVVEYSFEIDGERYKIHRSLSSKGTKNVYLYQYNNSTWESITQKTPAETEDRIQKIIKITHKAFQYSVLFRQADLSGMVEDKNGTESNTKSRIDILKEPLNLIRYSKKEKIVSDLMKPIKKDIEVKEAAISVIGDPDADINKSKDELNKTLEQLLEKENLIKNDLQISLEEKRNNLQHLKSTLSSSDADIHQKVEESHVKVKRLNYSIKELGESHKKALATITSQNQLLKIKKDSNLKLSEELSHREVEQHRDISTITQDYKKVSDDEIKGSKLLSRIEVELEFAKKSIPDSDNCPACQQSITTEYRKDFEDKMLKVIEQKEKDIEFYKEQLSKCRKIKNKIQKELDEAKQHISTLDNLRNQVKSVLESIQAYEENINNAEHEAKRIEGDLDLKSKELEEGIKHYNDLKELAERSDLTDLNTKIFSVAREIKVYEQSIQSIQTEIQTLKTREGVLKERIKNRNDDKSKLDSINAELTKLRHDLYIHQNVMNSFSHKGIPTLIINTCLNELQLETNRTLQQLRPDLEVQFDADLNFTYRRNGVPKDYHQLSYGQHVYIALAFKHGLAHVIQKKMNTDIKCIFFDEVDMPLDKAGKEALANAIKKWQEEFTILVITHDDQLKGKFSHAILVEEGDDGSEGRVVTSW